MSASAHRKEFQLAIQRKDFSKIHEFLQRDDAKELLLTKDDGGYLLIHDACRFKVDEPCFKLILDAAVEHRIIKKMLEEKDKYGSTCFHHLSCASELSTATPLRLLLEYSSKHADIKKIAEPENNGRTCLHSAFRSSLSTDSLRLLISFFPSKEIFDRVLAAKDLWYSKTPVDYAKRDEIKQLIQDPNCWQNCRLWLLQNHEDIFLYSLYPNSLDKTCRALQELTKNGLQQCQQRAAIMLIALMTSPSKFREAVDKTDSSALMASYFDVVKKGDKKSDYHHWRRSILLFREFYGQRPPSERKMATTYEGEGSSCSCSIQ